jgi:replicative DNA helicase
MNEELYDGLSIEEAANRYKHEALHWLFCDPKAAEEFRDFIYDAAFHCKDAAMRLVFRAILSLRNRSSAQLTLKRIEGELLARRRDFRLTKEQFLRAKTFLDSLQENEPDPALEDDYRQHLLDFFRYELLAPRIQQVAQLLESGETKDAVELLSSIRVPEPVKEEVYIVFPDMFGERNAKSVESTGIAAPTPSKAINDALFGGLKCGELGIIVGVPNSGKTSLLIGCGAAALRDGWDVLHFTFENSQESVFGRYCFAVFFPDDGDVEGHIQKYRSVLSIVERHYGRSADPDAKVTEEEKRLFEQTWNSLSRHGQAGRLFVKGYPAGECSVPQLKRLVKKHIEENDVRPLLIVDYAALLRGPSVSSRKDLQEHEWMELLTNELKQLAQDLEIPVWTAHQANRAAVGRQPGMENLAKSYGTAFSADVIITIHDPRDAERRNDRLQYDRTYAPIVLFLEKARVGRKGEKAKLSVRYDYLWYIDDGGVAADELV